MTWVVDPVETLLKCLVVDLFVPFFGGMKADPVTGCIVFVAAVTNTVEGVKPRSGRRKTMI